MSTQTEPTEYCEALDKALDIIKRDNNWESVFTIVTDEVFNENKT